MVSEFTWPSTLTMMVNSTGTASHGRIPPARLTHAPSDHWDEGTPVYATARIGAIYTRVTAPTAHSIVRGYVFCGSRTSWATVEALSQPMKFHMAITRPAYQLVCGAAGAIPRCGASNIISAKGASSRIPSAIEPSPTAFAPSRFQATQPKMTAAGIAMRQGLCSAAGQSWPSASTNSEG